MGFGPKVLGKEAYKKVVAATRGKAGFGPRVIGKIAPATSAPNAASARAVAGDPIAPNVPVATEGVSTEQVRSILAENPSFLEPLHVAELERSEGPRRDALLALQETAEKVGNAEIASEIAELLAGMPAVPPVPAPGLGGSGEPAPIDLAALAFNDLKAMAKAKGVDMNKNRSRVDITAALNKLL